MPQNPDMGGDFTLEFDSPVAATKGPEKGEGGAQDSPVPEAHLADPESPALLSDLAPGTLGGLLANAEGNIPNLARGPAGRSRGFLRGVTPAAADPLMTPGLAEVYETYGADETTTLGLQEETTVDSTATPDIQHTLMPRNKAQQPQIKRDAWHFQEPWESGDIGYFLYAQAPQLCPHSISVCENTYYPSAAKALKVLNTY